MRRQQAARGAREVWVKVPAGTGSAQAEPEAPKRLVRTLEPFTGRSRPVRPDGTQAEAIRGAPMRRSQFRSEQGERASQAELYLPMRSLPPCIWEGQNPISQPAQARSYLRPKSPKPGGARTKRAHYPHDAAQAEKAACDSCERAGLFASRHIERPSERHLFLFCSVAAPAVPAGTLTPGPSPSGGGGVSGEPIAEWHPCIGSVLAAGKRKHWWGDCSGRNFDPWAKSLRWAREARVNGSHCRLAPEYWLGAGRRRAEALVGRLFRPEL